MLKRDNGRGVHPVLRSTSHRFWPMDDVVRGTALDLSPQGVDLTDVGVGSVESPFLVAGMIGGRATRFEDSAEVTGVTLPQDNTLSSAGDASSQIVHEGEFTFGMWFRNRRPASGTGDSHIYAYMGNDSLDTAAENFMFALRTSRGLANDPLRFSVFWEWSTGSNLDVVTFDDYAIPLNEWIYVVIRKRLVVAGAGPTGVAVLDLFVNGNLVQTAYGTGSITTPSGTWTWDGTTTVLSNDTSGVSLNDYVRRTSDSAFFRITAITANVDVTIENVDSLTIPSGAGVEKRGPITNTSDGADAVYILGGKWEGAAVAATEFGTFDCCGMYLWSEVLALEDIEDDFRRGHLLPFYHRVDTKVVIEGPPPVSQLVDVTNLFGLDWLVGVDITDNVDANTVGATVRLMREQENMSLATLKTDTPANLETLNDVTSYDPFLFPKRAIHIYTARVPLGIEAVPDDYVHRFDGKIDEVENGSNPIELRCRDKGGALVDFYPKTERDWHPSAATGTLESVMQDHLDAWDSLAITGGYAPTTVYAPAPSQWTMNLQEGEEPLRQLRARREPIMTTMRALAGQIAFDSRYRFDNDPDEQRWRFTLYEPQRARLDQDIVLRAGEVLGVSGAGISAQRVRNSIRSAYRSSQAPGTTPTTAIQTPFTDDYQNVGYDGFGNRVLAYYEATSPDSVDQFDLIFMEVQEKSGSQIDTIDEAQRMVAGMLLDLEEPDFEHTIKLIPLPELDVGDMAKMDINPQLYTGKQRLAIKSVTHKLGDKPSTDVQLRGKPSVGFKRWLSLDTRPGVGGAPPVIDTAESLTDADAGMLLRFITGYTERTDYLGGGRAVEIKNNDFAKTSKGQANPPDGWRILQGTWDTDAELEETAANVKTGKHAVRITGSGNVLLISDLIPVEESQPYMMEITSLRTNGADAPLSVTCQTYEADRVTTAGSTTFNPAISAGANVYETRRRFHGMSTTAKWAQIRAVAPGTQAGEYLIDKLNLYRISHEAEMRKTAVQVAVAAAWTQYDLDDDNSAQATGDGPHDYGGIATPGANQFDIVEEGFYDLGANLLFAGTGGLVVGQVSGVRILRNGTVVAENTGASIQIGVTIFHRRMVTRAMQLLPGDAITVEYYLSAIPATPTVGIESRAWVKQRYSD